MDRLFLIGLLLMISISNFAQDNKLFTEILSQNVKDGLVDYSNLQKDKRFDKYLEDLTNTDPQKFSEKEKLSFWINVYNAFTLKIVADNYPIESITDLHSGGKIIGYLLGNTVWDKEFITINKKEYSLNDIEHEILRKMNEPRIHFAIVCASISCPILRSEAYEANKLEMQLEDQTKIFLNDPGRNHFDTTNKEAYISKVFDWFDEDFGTTDEDVLKFISKYLPENISKNIIANIDKWDISYNDYNWNLNELKK